MYYTGLFAGFGLALGTGTFVENALGWRWVFLLPALAGLLLATVAFGTVPEPLVSRSDEELSLGDKLPQHGDDSSIVDAASPPFHWTLQLSPMSSVAPSSVMGSPAVDVDRGRRVSDIDRGRRVSGVTEST